MALNTLKRNQLTPLRFKGLKIGIEPETNILSYLPSVLVYGVYGSRLGGL